MNSDGLLVTGVLFFNNSDLGEIGFPSYLIMILYQLSEIIFFLVSNVNMEFCLF